MVEIVDTVHILEIVGAFVMVEIDIVDIVEIVDIVGIVDIVDSNIKKVRLCL